MKHQRANIEYHSSDGVITGWHGSIAEFKEIEKIDLITQFTILYEANLQQAQSWKKTLHFLDDCFGSTPKFDDMYIYIILEYEIPRQGGRRPDLIILGRRKVFVVEIKDKMNYAISDLVQTRGYYRDIIAYHEKSQNYEIYGGLLLLRSEVRRKENKIHVISQPKHLIDFLHEKEFKGISPEVAEQWIHSDFEPLPSLVEAAKLIFENRALPQIKQVHRAEIPETMLAIHRITLDAIEKKEHRLILVSGIPGSGKTLVGLLFVHEFSDPHDVDRRAVYMSGNGPLIEVLQHALDSKVFVQDVHAFIREYGLDPEKIPKEHVLVFDEAQRAWDSEKVRDWYKKKKNIDVYKSEPELFIEISSRKSWGVVIALIGDGQEIHTGEESGIGQWYDAITSSTKSWKAYGAQGFKSEFGKHTYQIEPMLDLNLSLRSHEAEKLGKWVEAVISADKKKAAKLSRFLKDHLFYLYITDDLDRAKSFLRHTYEGEESKTFGMIASSKASNLAEYSIDPGYMSRDVVPYGKVGHWYYKKDKPELHATTFNQLVTEFSCQGLELDGILLAWGKDFRWSKKDREWKSINFTSRNSAKDPFQLRENSYRVLLTRGRDGIVVFCPRDEVMTDTYDFLIDIGFEELDDDVDGDYDDSDNDGKDDGPIQNNTESSSSTTQHGNQGLSYFLAKTEKPTDIDGLSLYRGYSRRQVAVIFEPEYDFHPGQGSWGLSGIVRIKPGKDYVFFVTLDKSNIEGYDYQDKISSSGIVHWETQKRHDQKSTFVKHLINLDTSKHDIHLFVREDKKGPDGRPRKYLYLGRLDYISHDPVSNNPVSFVMKMLDLSE